MTTRKANAAATPRDEATQPRYRTAAVARMLQMPAATLRIWERRYGVVAPATTLAGHRQYSAADVQRLAMLRQLTAVGHPIGSIASLAIERLREVAATHAAALTRVSQTKRPRRSADWKVAVIGSAAAHRVQRPGVQMRLGRAVRVTGEFKRIADVRRGASGARHDAMIVFVDGLLSSMLAELRVAARALRAGRVAVVYSFASESAVHAFLAAGLALLREPADDLRLADWLSALASPRGRDRSNAAAEPKHDPLMSSVVPQPRRYDDAALADFAGLSSTIACECPRHVAEILVQLSHFEAYSAQCQRLSAGDAALHAYLGRVAAAARSLFETALERVAVQEGLVLPGG